MGGEVGVESGQGRGSTFWFTAWLKIGQTVDEISNLDAALDSKQELLSYYRGAKILLAEDNQINREMMAALLSDAGLSIETAETGNIVLVKLEKMDFDLILMDIRMPEMNGLEAAQLIRQQDKYRTLPIIALSANAFEEDRQTCLDAGMNNFILKPVAPDDLFKVLIKWLPKKSRQVLIEDEFTDEDNRFELVQSDDIDSV